MPVKRDWYVNIGIAISATAAAVASFAGLRGLAVFAGWPEPLAALLPLTVDALAMTATRVWLAASTASHRARRFARSIAWLAVVMSLAGNSVYHLIAAGLLRVTGTVVVVVGAVPAATLALTAHLAALRSLADQPVAESTESVPRTAGQNEVRTPNRTGDELLEAAKQADATYRAANDGRPITRDALRAALRVSARRAAEVRRQLKELQATQEAAYQ